MHFMDCSTFSIGNGNVKDAGKIKRKRIRRFPNKKWTDSEHAILLQFLKNNRPIEKPTSQIYYRRFLAETNLDTQWFILRSKVRNMRVAYNKAKALKSCDTENPREGHTFDEEILRICPFFYELNDVFNSEEMELEQIVFNTAEDNSFYTDSSSRTSRTAVSETLEVSSDLLPIKTETLEIKEVDSTETREDDLRTPQLKADKETLVEECDLKGWENDRNVGVWQTELKQRQFNFQREKELKLLELKEMEIKSRERLKILELEMQERIAIKEIEMKERIAMKELEIKKQSE